MDVFVRVKERLSETYSEYETKIEKHSGCDFFVIVNPFGGENIKVSTEDGIIFFFAYQHAHFDYCEDIDDNIDSLIDYINAFISEGMVSYEFLNGKTPLFGGSRYLDDINASSGESLLKSFASDSGAKEFDAKLYETLLNNIKGLNCRCSIRGWDGKSNKDIDFTL